MIGILHPVFSLKVLREREVCLQQTIAVSKSQEMRCQLEPSVRCSELECNGVIKSINGIRHIEKR